MSHLQGNAAEEPMLEEAKSFIRASGQFRTVPDLAELLRVEIHDLDQQLNEWKDRREIFSIQDGTEGELFPLFAFDRNRGPQVAAAIASLIRRIDRAQIQRRHNIHQKTRQVTLGKPIVKRRREKQRLVHVVRKKALAHTQIVN